MTALAPDAAMALGIAATAMPFARTPEDEAERWLRVLRLHGEAGIALQALGVSEGQLPAASAGSSPRTVGAGSSQAASAASPRTSSRGSAREQAERAAVDDRDAVGQVTAHAVEIAGRRGAGGVGTRDLLEAVMRIYGEDFDRVLRAHGTDRDEVLERLATGH
jgi:hypothetical protein